MKKLVKLFTSGNFSARYVVALLIIGFLSLILQIVVQLNLDGQKNGLIAIQRAREHIKEVENIKKKLYSIQTIPDAKHMQLELIEAKKEINNTLLLGEKIWISPKSTELTSLLSPEYNHQQVIKQIFESLNQHSENMIKLPLDKRAEIASSLFEQNEIITKFIRFANQELETAGFNLGKQLDNFKRLELIIFLLTILVLLFEDLFIFRPAINKLNRALQARSDFFSRIGHEIRNPMNSILGMANLIEESKLTPTQHTYLDRLKKSAQGLLYFLNNVIEFAGIENKKIATTIEIVDLKILVEEITGLFSIDTHQKNLGFYIYVHDLPEKIETDYLKIRHILFNLIGNAIKFTDHGAIFLDIRFQKNSSSLIIKVKDTGIGIPLEKQEIIFEEFTQADSSVKRRHGGTGLGLTIIREYLDLLNGKITVNSEVSKGSAFIVTIPVSNPQGIVPTTLPAFKNIFVMGDEYLFDWVHFHMDQNTHLVQIKSIFDIPNNLTENEECVLFAAKGSKLEDLFLPDLQVFMADMRALDTTQEILKNVQMLFPLVSWAVTPKTLSQDVVSSHLSPLNVLVCDDSYDNRFILSSYLQKIFIKIDEAKDGKECLDMCAVKNYHIIFLDIQMPEYDGYSVINFLKQDNYQGLVIACTAHNSELESNKIKNSGFSAHLTKPITFQSVVTLLKGLRMNNKNDKPTSDENFESRIKKKLMEKKPIFIAHKIEEIAAIISGKKLDEMKELSNFGHKLKGSASNYGFQELTELGGELEKLANNNQIKPSQDLFHKIHHMILDLKN